MEKQLSQAGKVSQAHARADEHVHALYGYPRRVRENANQPSGKTPLRAAAVQEKSSDDYVYYTYTYVTHVSYVYGGILYTCMYPDPIRTKSV